MTGSPTQPPPLSSVPGVVPGPRVVPPLWTLVNAPGRHDARAIRVICACLACVYGLLVLIRADSSDLLPTAMRLVVVGYAALGAVLAEPLAKRHLDSYTLGMALLLPSLSLSANSLHGGPPTELLLTGVAILASFPFLQNGRHVLAALIALPAVFALLTFFVLPPQVLPLTTRATVLGLCIILGAALALALQVYRGLLWDAERAVREAFEDAHEASVAKSAFLATMSHELRTPMTGVIGTADLLARSNLGMAEMDHVRTIQKSSEALLRVINDILDFSKVEAGAIALEPQPVDIALELAGAITLMKPIAESKGLRLRASCRVQPPVQVFDALRFRQVVLNLISNALKFTERGGVEVRVRNVALDGRDDRDQLLRCEVEDTGPGIPEGQHAAMFEPFVQLNAGTSRSHGGTGLGLAISARLVRLMGGDIRVAAAPSGGTIFSFEVRTSHAGSAKPRPRTSPHVAPLEATAAVLVVDDQVVNRQVVSAMLKQLNYTRVDTVEGGAQAIEAVRTQRYDVVLMDMQMPDVDGVQATRTIRSEPLFATHPRIIALTANALESDRKLCLDSGMDDFLAKPLTMDALERTMRRAERHLRQSRAADGV